MIDVLELTQKIIRCPSVTPADAGAQKVLIDALKPMGFKVKKLKFSEAGTSDIENFFARYGESGKHLCFAGHTDVVPVGDRAAWKFDPFGAEIKNGVLYGRGTSDMKGGICAFVAAASEFLSEQKNFKGSISFLITGDEEGPAINGTRKVLEWMRENNNIPDVALVGESSNTYELGEEIKIGRRGSLSGLLKVHGKQGHVAYPDKAENPIHRLAEMTQTLSSYIFDKGSAFFPPSSLQFVKMHVDNEADNVIPAEASAQFNIRFSDRWNTVALDRKIRDILDATGYRYTLETWSNYAESFITKPGEWTKDVSDAVEHVTGRKPDLTTKGGTSDARFITNYCPVVEFGLTNETIHQVDENCKVDDLYRLVKIYKKILENYF